MKRRVVVTEHATNRRAVTVAACAASLLMFVHALVHRAVADKLESPATTPLFDPNMLRAFPMQIADWAGEEVPMDEAIRARTDAEGHVNRRYARKGGLETVSFYLACGVKARDLMPHRPEVCYVGNGWTRTGRRSESLSLADGAALPCNLIEFSRGLLNTEKILVLHYYIVDGRYCQDVSLLRSKAWRGSGTVRYVVQIQVTAPLREVTGADAAARAVCDFAVESASFITGLFNSCQPQSGCELASEPVE